MGDGHSRRNVVVAGHTVERTRCATRTDYSTLSYGREVAGWPSLQMGEIRWCSEQMAEHIGCLPESKNGRAEF